MKKVFAILLLASMLIPACALAYVDAVSGATTSSPTPVYGWLNTRMATRTGPSTKYEEPGAFGQAGDVVKIISIGYSSVPWVQVEANLNGRLMRVYTGLKRIDGVGQFDVVQESNLNIPARLTTSVVPLYGPGPRFASYRTSIGSGKMVTIMDFEGDYAMCDYRMPGKDKWSRMWIPKYALSY